MQMLNNEKKQLVDALASIDNYVIDEAAQLCIQSLKNNNKILLCGNGGSAADCQHFAAELVGRFGFDRAALPAIALTVDTSILTAVSNDYQYSKVFSRQVEALGKANDILFCISTSGNSENIVNAAIAAKQLKMKVISLVGQIDCKLHDISDIIVSVVANKTCHIQECHLFIEHCICSCIEQTLYGKAKSIVS